MKNISRATAFLLALILFAASPERAAAQFETFRCEGGVAFNARFAPDGESVAVTFADRTSAAMTQAIAGSGTRYVGGGYELHGKANQWVLTRPNGQTIRCASGGAQPVRAAPPPPPPPPVAQQTRFPVSGHSFGGKVRSGPGLNFSKSASMSEGEPLTILSYAGQMDGYSWFKIRYRGRTGYQWGGIMCSNGFKVPGILEVCPRFQKAVAPPRPACRKGQYWSRSKGRCVWHKRKVKKIIRKTRRCPPGQVWSEEGNQCRGRMEEFCGPGYRWNPPTKTCVPRS